MNFLRKCLTVPGLAVIILGFVAVMIGSALVLEYTQELEPCPLCLIQRWALLPVVLGAVILLWLPTQPVGLVVSGLGVIAGGSTAARQLYLQFLGPDQAPACGPPLEYLVESGAGFAKIVDYFWAGDVSCATVQWSLLGVSIPGWSFVGYTMLAVVLVVAWKKQKQAHIKKTGDLE